MDTNPLTGAAIEVKQFGNRFAQIDYKTSGGTDHYDSMQTTLNRRFSKGFTMGAQWTYGHSIGNTGGSNEAQTSNNPNNFAGERGNNAFDVRHSANLSAMYELPFGKKSTGATKALLGGWEVGGVVNARTGLPMDVKITQAIVDALKKLHDVPDDLQKRFDAATPAGSGEFLIKLSEDQAMALGELLQWHIRTDPATGKPTAESAPYADLITRVDEAQF